MTKLQKQIDDLKQVLEAGDVILRKLLEEEEAEKEHMWEHGDVFEWQGCKMLYVNPVCHDKADYTQVIYFCAAMRARGSVQSYLDSAKFLFNIKEKL